MATIVRKVNLKFESIWTESQLQYSVQKDYGFFLMLIGFIAPLLGGSLYTALSDMGGKPLKLFKLIALGVPEVHTSPCHPSQPDRILRNVNKSDVLCAGRESPASPLLL